MIPALLGGRYDVLGERDVGAVGFVYDVRDRFDPSADRVAKLTLLDASDRAWDDSRRRERALLRWLRLPGVVELLDEGTEGEWGYLIMPRVPGGPFLAVQDTPAPWEALRVPVIALFETLARVHLRGVVHLDLKPNNVLVGRDGLPVVLDFGFSRGAVGPLPPSLPGPEWYASPEQASGDPVDARADLYSVGVMLLSALAGCKDGDVRIEQRFTPELLDARLSEVPPSVRGLILRLVDPDPNRRPSSALDVLDALGAPPTVLPGAFVPEMRAACAAELEPLFDGPNHYLHLPEDGARVLFARTGGHTALVREELDGWVRAGLAVFLGGRLRVQRDEIERLTTLRLARPTVVPPPLAAAYKDLQARWRSTDGVDVLPGEEASVASLEAAGLLWRLGERVGLRPELVEEGPPSFLGEFGDVTAPIAEADAWVQRDRPHQALALLSSLVPLMAARGDRPATQALVIRYVEVALALQGQWLLARNLVERHRGLCEGHATFRTVWSDLDELVHAAADFERDQLASCAARLSRLPAELPGDLELRRKALALFVGARVDGGEAVFETLDAWVDRDPARRAPIAEVGRLGRAYVARRFTEAEGCARRLVVGGGPTLAVNTTHNLVMTMYETGHDDALALGLCREALRRAVSARLSVQEASLRFFERLLLLRGAPAAFPPPLPDPSLVEDAHWDGSPLRPALAARLGLVECAIAWRSCDPVAGALGGIALRHARLAGGSIVSLVEALHGAVSGATRRDAEGWVEALPNGQAGPGLLPPLIAMQVVGLARITVGDPTGEWAKKARMYARVGDLVDVERRREVLSGVECWRTPPQPPTWHREQQ